MSIPCRLAQGFARLTDWCVAAPLFVLLVIFNVAVVMRYFFASPLYWTEEVSGLLMIWIVMLGGVAAERDDEQLAIPMFVDLLPRRLAALVNLVTALASALFLLYVAWMGLRLALSVGSKVTSILRLSWFWIDLAVPVGFVLMALYMVAHAVAGARRAFAAEGRA